MRKAHLTRLAAVTLLFTGAQAQASVTVRVASSLDSDDLRIASAVEQIDQAGGVVMSVGFQASGIISGRQFTPPGSTLSASGSVSGAFFGSGRAASGVVDVPLSSGSLSSGSSPRYAVPFFASATAGALTPVPEPSSWALMLAGAMGLAGLVSTQAQRRA